METQEPADHFRYRGITVYAETLEFFQRALRSYEDMLEAEISDLTGDGDLAVILGPKRLDGFGLPRELKRVGAVREWLQQVQERQGKESVEYELSTDHGTVRLLKTVGVLYLKSLTKRRHHFASRPNVLVEALRAVDTCLLSRKEALERGVFASATAFPTLVDQYSVPEPLPQQDPSSDAHLELVRSPRPVFIDRIEIINPELRRRCLDLLHQFSADGQQDRLDTVVAEATRIFEDRLRSVSSQPPTAVGTELASRALGGPQPCLQVAPVSSAQDGFHHLCRGIFGFIRNQTAHHLVGELDPKRVAQILGLVDYALFVVESARRAPESSSETQVGASTDAG